MPIYTPAPIWVDNVGQLLSHEDLDIIRENCVYAELLSYRFSPGFPSSGGVDTRTPGYYPNSGTFTIWFGNLRFQTGMTTLTVTGTSANPGSMTFKVYINNALVMTVSPTATWSGTYTLTGFADGEVMDVQVRAVFSSGGAPANAKYVVTAIYGSPVVYATAWPGVPTFTTAWTAAKLNQLCNASAWIYNRANATPIRPDLALLYMLAPYSGISYPIYYGSVVRNFSNSQFVLYGQVENGSSPGFVLDVYFNGSLVYTTANMPPGTTTVFFTLSLAAYSVGASVEVAVYANNTVAAAQADWSYSRVTLYAMRSQVDTSAIYSSVTATPLEDTSISPATLAAYLNNLSSVVLAAYNRIIATPAIFDRVWAMRRFFSRANDFSDGGSPRGRPRFVRQGTRLIVRGKGLSIGYGPISVPTNERGLQFDDYKLLHTQSITDSDKVQTKEVYLDTLPGLTPGVAYFILGDCIWAEERVQ